MVVERRATIFLGYVTTPETDCRFSGTRTTDGRARTTNGRATALSALLMAGYNLIASDGHSERHRWELCLGENAERRMCVK